VRISPSSWTWAPLVRLAVKAPSLPQAMQRCQVVCDSYSPVSRFFHRRLVANESTVKTALLPVVLTSASLPRYPMRMTRFMLRFSFSAPVSLGAPKGKRSRSQASRSAFLGGPGEVLVSTANAPVRAESRLGEPRKQNEGKRRARLGCFQPSSVAVPERPREERESTAAAASSRLDTENERGRKVKTP
jgi:hypothetical protein